MGCVQNVALEHGYLKCDVTATAFACEVSQKNFLLSGKEPEISWEVPPCASSKLTEEYPGFTSKES